MALVWFSKGEDSPQFLGTVFQKGHGHSNAMSTSANSLTNSQTNSQTPAQKTKGDPHVFPEYSIFNIFTHIWHIFMVNVGIYTINGMFGT